MTNSKTICHAYFTSVCHKSIPNKTQNKTKQNKTNEKKTNILL